MRTTATATLLSPLDLLDGHTRQRTLIHDQVQSQALSAFGLVPGFSESEAVDQLLGELFPPEQAVDDFLARMFPVVTGGQALVASTTTNYVAQTVGSLTGTPPVLTQAAITGVAALRGTPFYQVYKRPILVVSAALAAGATTAVAVHLGRKRLRTIVGDDLNLAHRASALQAISSDDRIVGYRRVIRPELSKGTVCGLCIAASDRRYYKSDLMPLHTDCNCGVMPIVRTGRGKVKDPGRTINGESVTELYNQATEAAGGYDRESLKAVKFDVHEHGELGPVLRKAGDHFRTLAEARTIAEDAA